MTTNNHPAHGPVSLDRLHQIREILSKASAQSDGGNLGYAMADAVKVIDGAIAAFGAETAPLQLPVQHWEELCRQNPDMSIGDAIIRAAWWNHCAAMLQAGNHTEQNLDMVDHSGDANEKVEPVIKPYKLPFDQWLSQQDGTIDVDCGCVTTEAFYHWLRVAYEASNSPVTPDCSCRTCRPVTFTDSRFVVCPECGNKRCPHANDHRNACTGSNEPGQEGSAYPAAPKQEVNRG
ncbi:MULTISPECIES: hypothetical protein [Citrobacter freundii complex]|uniref:hypothetical protein n=1 Tax=Citrobacter freundii complex TaxID=1344959 RepID=UPI001D0BB528|nr:hypothetical protein [Citrobacter werkmanii]